MSSFEYHNATCYNFTVYYPLPPPFELDLTADHSVSSATSHMLEVQFVDRIQQKPSIAVQCNLLLYTSNEDNVAMIQVTAAKSRLYPAQVR